MKVCLLLTAAAQAFLEVYPEQAEKLQAFPCKGECQFSKPRDEPRAAPAHVQGVCPEEDYSLLLGQ